MSEEGYYQKIKRPPSQGKGDNRRPTNEANYREGWDRIFGPRPCPTCGGLGYWVHGNFHTGEPEQMQCETCRGSGEL